MGFHTFDPSEAARLDDESRYRWCSSEELVSLVAPHENAAVADLGSGTGFYTDEIAPYTGTVYAIDVQPVMHGHYGDNGVPENVRRITAEVDTLPLADDALDAAFSTMTYHEFGGERAVAELARVLRPGGRLVTVDWAESGNQAAGPPPTERYSLGDVASMLTDAGFTVDHAVTRTETLVCRARR